MLLTCEQDLQAYILCLVFESYALIDLQCQTRFISSFISFGVGVHHVFKNKIKLKTMLLTLASPNGQVLYKRGHSCTQVVDVGKWRYTYGKVTHHK
jgi:hypothetical protein